MTEILRERDEHGAYILAPPDWWKFIYETKTSTWQKFGCVAYVQATSVDKAREAGFTAARAEFPGAEIIPLELRQSTYEAAHAQEMQRQRLAEWAKNVKQGTPNTRQTLEPGRESGS